MTLQELRALMVKRSAKEGEADPYCQCLLYSLDGLENIAHNVSAHGTPSYYQAVASLEAIEKVIERV